MWKIIKKIVEEMEKNEKFHISVSTSLVGDNSFLSTQLIGCFEDPTENENTLQLIRNFYKKNNSNEHERKVGKEHTKSMNDIMDNILGDLKKTLDI